jgi:sugar/nucleoside kinase (ribokinase family)
MDTKTPRTSKRNIAVIGDIFCDILASNMVALPRWGEDTLSPISILPGGSALNTTVHCANYSQFTVSAMHVTLHSAVGCDSQAKVCCDILQDSTITANVITVPNGRTGTCLVLSGEDRAFVTDRGVVDDMVLDWFKCDDIFTAETCHLHCAGFYNCGAMAPHWRELLEKVTDIHVAHLIGLIFVRIRRSSMMSQHL